MLVAWTALAVLGSLLTPPRCGVVSMGGSKSKGGAKKKPASSGGGFGAAPPPPPTLDEVCAKLSLSAEQATEAMHDLFPDCVWVQR